MGGYKTKKKTLSSWQRQIYQRVVHHGDSNREIAKRFGRTEVAVKKAVSTILFKASVTSRVQLIVNFAKHGEMK